MITKEVNCSGYKVVLWSGISVEGKVVNGVMIGDVKPIPGVRQLNALIHLNPAAVDTAHKLDAKFAGARGFVDAIVPPEETRDTLAFLLEVTTQFTGPHIGPFVLPSFP